MRKIHKKTFSVRITEVESYVGEHDRACHASKGKTKRTEVMFGEAGHAYVYMIYGMYFCLNVVTEEKDFPAAVLIRGAEEIKGPGKLCRALSIDKTLNAHDLTLGKKLFIADDGFRISKKDIHTSPRINVDYAGPDALLPWRYFIQI